MAEGICPLLPVFQVISVPMLHDGYDPWLVPSPPELCLCAHSKTVNWS